MPLAATCPKGLAACACPGALSSGLARCPALPAVLHATLADGCLPPLVGRCHPLPVASLPQRPNPGHVPRAITPGHDRLMPCRRWATHALFDACGPTGAHDECHN